MDDEIDAYATISYLQLMQKHFVDFTSRNNLPNKSEKYKVVVLKVKAPAICLDSDPNMTVMVGRDTEIYGKEVANQIKCDGTEEYWIFDFSDEPDFYSDVISSMKINWAYSVGEESNLDAEFVLMGFQFYKTIEDAMSATGGEAATEKPTEAPTAAPETEAPTDAPATEAPTTQETEPAKGGCGSVIGFSAIAVLAAAAAAVALKKD